MGFWGFGVYMVSHTVMRNWKHCRKVTQMWALMNIFIPENAIMKTKWLRQVNTLAIVE